MTRDPQRLADYLSHIREAIEHIHEYVAEIDETAFLQNSLLQDAVIRNIEIIGEASQNIAQRYPDFAQDHPELPLAFVYLNAQCRRPRLFQGRSGNRLENDSWRPVVASPASHRYSAANASDRLTRHQCGFCSSCPQIIQHIGPVKMSAFVGTPVFATLAMKES